MDKIMMNVLLIVFVISISSVLGSLAILTIVAAYKELMKIIKEINKNEVR